jgi:hypothetical protein
MASPFSSLYLGWDGTARNAALHPPQVENLAAGSYTKGVVPGQSAAEGSGSWWICSKQAVMHLY